MSRFILRVLIGAAVACVAHAQPKPPPEKAPSSDAKAPDAELLCNMVKLFASETVLEVCKHAMELHGGNGTMLEFGIEKLYRDASMYLHMDGTVDITKFKIVKNLFPDTAGKYAGPET